MRHWNVIQSKEKNPASCAPTPPLPSPPWARASHQPPQAIREAPSTLPVVAAPAAEPAAAAPLPEREISPLASGRRRAIGTVQHHRCRSPRGAERIPSAPGCLCVFLNPRHHHHRQTAKKVPMIPVATTTKQPSRPSFQCHLHASAPYCSSLQAPSIKHQAPSTKHQATKAASNQKLLICDESKLGSVAYLPPSPALRDHRAATQNP